MEDAVLIANNGPLNGQQWIIDGTLVIGRDVSCDIVIPDRQVSRQHARITKGNNGVILEDLGSKNGTFLNNQVVSEPVKLVEADEIAIALTQTFLYLSSDATMPLSDLPPELSHVLSLRLDESSRRVWVRGVELEPPLSNQQFVLLAYLYARAGEVVSREELIQVVWEDDTRWVTEQAFDALVRRLRERLNQPDPDYDYIVTVRGHGLRFQNEPH
ncbi:MAG: FHA domain-containing protein [Anaerolineaceae bacterium]|mgnify:FL=1|jgi:pSer/pThr/pTyr-binding forkhead associated (FHA) protein|nr:FHA domain-containing protein [Anaerolineaceae bacterium]MDD4042758.1 FHA domain-containing protein [Anaerolineaceae bacterium]MDD4578123.1 FHA domain-containing protein [Anaerolineaceae bacterium]